MERERGKKGELERRRETHEHDMKQGKKINPLKHKTKSGKMGGKQD
jgi:hypothetical protein